MTQKPTNEAPIPHKNGILRFVDIDKDTTENKRAEEALGKSEALLRTVINTIPDLVWLKDPDGVYLSCNTKFERFFGAKQSDIVGKTDYNFVDKGLADFFREKVSWLWPPACPALMKKRLSSKQKNKVSY